MTLTDFINKYNGKKIERYDSSSKYQCVDLFLAYLDEVLGLSSIIPIGIVNAYDIYNKVHKFTPHSTKYKNTPTFIPQRGDVAVWSSRYGRAGHVAIVTEADINRFKAFSQNDPIGSPSIINNYSYKNVLGFLRPNNLPSDNDPLAECLAQHTKLVDEITQLKKNLAQQKIDFEATEKRLQKEKDKIVKDDEKKVNKLNEKCDEYQIERDKAVGVSKGYEKTISRLEDDLIKVTSERDALLAKAKQPIPYKSKWEEAVTELEELTAHYSKTHILKAQNTYLLKLQELALDIDQRIRI